jgi:hypothetical protein
LEDNAKRAVPDDFALRVLKLPGFASDAILYLLANDFYAIVSLLPPATSYMNLRSPPILRVLKPAGRLDAIVGKPAYSCYRWFRSVKLPRAQQAREIVG